MNVEYEERHWFGDYFQCQRVVELEQGETLSNDVLLFLLPPPQQGSKRLEQYYEQGDFFHYADFLDVYEGEAIDTPMQYECFYIILADDNKQRLRWLYPFGYGDGPTEPVACQQAQSKLYQLEAEGADIIVAGKAHAIDYGEGFKIDSPMPREE